MNKPLGDSITGAFLGVILLYFIKFTGKRYLLIKALGFAWLIWLGLFGIIVNIHIIRITPMDIGTNLSGFISHSIFGIVTAWAIKKFGKELIEN